jgi:hypothetical protein
VGNEKFSHAQAHVETVREQLAKGTDAVRSALEVEKGSRMEEAVRLEEMVATSELNQTHQVEELKKFVSHEIDNQEKERNKVVGMIVEEGRKVEERVGEKIISESQYARERSLRTDVNPTQVANSPSVPQVHPLPAQGVGVRGGLRAHERRARGEGVGREQAHGREGHLEGPGREGKWDRSGGGKKSAPLILAPLRTRSSCSPRPPSGSTWRRARGLPWTPRS